MKSLIKIVMVALIVVIPILSLYGIKEEKKQFGFKLAELTATVEILREQNNFLEKEVEYFSYPENLIKELKSKFNYREEGEKIIIIVPGNNN